MSANRSGGAIRGRAEGRTSTFALSEPELVGAGLFAHHNQLRHSVRRGGDVEQVGQLGYTQILVAPANEFVLGYKNPAMRTGRQTDHKIRVRTNDTGHSIDWTRRVASRLFTQGVAWRARVLSGI